MDTKEILEMLKDRYDHYVTTTMDASYDPQLLKFAKIFSKALEDVLKELDQ